MENMSENKSENKFIVQKTTWPIPGEKSKVIGVAVYKIMHTEGHCSCQLTRDVCTQSVYITQLFTTSGYRDAGLATEALSMCEEVAKREGVKVLMLCVDIFEDDEKNRIKLLKFYQKRGYIIYNKDENSFSLLKTIE